MKLLRHPLIPLLILLLIAVFILLFYPDSAPVSNKPVSPDSPDNTVTELHSPIPDFKSWIDEWNNMPPSEQPTRLDIGIRLAKERRQQMIKLIRTDPAAALELSISLSEWINLPAEIQPYMEEPISTLAKVDVYISCGEASSIDRITTLPEGSSFETFSAAAKRLTKSSTALPVQGIRIGEVGALRPSVFQLLEGDDLEAARSLYPIANPDPDRCALTGDLLKSQSVAGLSGGYLFFFKDRTAMEQLEDELAQLDALPGPDTASALLTSAWDSSSAEDGLDLSTIKNKAVAAATEWSGGERTMYVILVDFDDLPGQPTDPAMLEYNINTYVSSMFFDMSYQSTYVTCTVDTNTYRMPLPTSGYTTNHLPMHDHAYTAVTNAGVDLSTYGTVCVYFNRIPQITFEGYAHIGGSKMWLNDNGSIYVVTHELGHNYGSYHASSWDVMGTDPVDPAGTRDEYGSPLDIMGRGSFPNGHLHVQNKLQVGWLTENHIETASTSGTYRIYRSDHALTDPETIRGLRYDLNGSNTYWVGYRQLYPDYEYYGRGTYILWQSNPNNWPKSDLLDMTPGSSGGKLDGGLSLGTTWSDISSGFHITPVQRGGLMPNEWMDITVNLGDFSLNTPPTAALQGPTHIHTRESVIYAVTASDPEADPLAYHWDFGDGRIHDNRSRAAMTWMDPGDKTVRCIVSDMKGGTVTNEMTVTVSEELRWPHQQSITSYELFDIATDGQVLVAVGRGGFTATSTNGVDWTTGSLGAGTANVYLRGIIHDSAQFITVGMDWDSTLSAWVGVIYTSPDGAIWTQRHKSTQPGLTDVAVLGNIRVAVGSAGTILRSTNGQSWNVINSGITGDLRNISSSINLFCVVGLAPGGGANLVYVSGNGLNWNDRSAYTTTGTGNFNDLENCNGQLLAGGYLVGIHRSTDNGASFSEVAPNSTRVAGLAYGNGLYFAAGISGSTDANLVSSDGMNWRTIETDLQSDRNSAVFFKDTFITVGKNGSIWKSAPISPSSGGWALWQNNHSTSLGLNRDLHNDPDGDGTANLIEYALGTDPGDAASVPQISTGLNPDGFLQFDIVRAYEAHDINYSLERNTNLLEYTGWYPLSPAIITNLSNQLILRSTDPAGMYNNAYLRLKFELE